MFKIVVVDPLPERFADIFRKQLPREAFSFDCPENAQSEELARPIPGAHALVTRHRLVDSELIAEAGKTLRLIQVMGRLPDRVDLIATEKAGIPVAVMPHGGAIAVAEHTMALMLALVRKIVPGHAGVVDGSYKLRGLEPTETTEWTFAFNWLGFNDVTELRGKTLGLIGLGEIGREVARRAKSFDMSIVYHQRRRLPERYEQILGVRKVPVEELLRVSDIVSLHAPHTPETERILSAQRLELMKPTAFLVNTSRGGLVDEGALVKHLQEHKIAGAGLDVFVEEPLPAEHPLVNLDNVVLAPHTGGGSGGGQKKLIGQVIENITRMTMGETPINLVTSKQ